MKQTVYQIVDKISKSLESGVVYQTNEDILKPVEGNRGDINGIQKKRIEHYIALMRNDMFFADASIIIVNYFGDIIDGTHRYLACVILNRPVYFTITADERLNVLDRDILLDNIAIFNGSNPTWTAKQHQKSAVISGSPLAMAFEDIHAKIVGDKKLEITAKDLTTNQMYTFLTKNAKSLHGMKRNRIVFKDKELTKTAKSKEFYVELKQICNVIRYFKVGSIRPSKILERLMPLVWDNKVDIEVFYNNLRVKGLQFRLGEPVTAKSIESKILRLVGVKES